MKSAVLSLRISPNQQTRLRKIARRAGRTPSEIGAALLDEAIRRDEFALIDFRNTGAGRQAYVAGTRVQVWFVCHVLQQYKGDLKKTARHFGWPLPRVQASVNYANAFPAEIREAIQEFKETDATEIAKTLPNLEMVRV